MTDSLAARAYVNALRMYESDNRMVRPKPEDFTQLDTAAPVPAAPEAPAPTPAPVVAPTATDDAVRAALARMQAETRVRFAAPPDAAA